MVLTDGKHVHDAPGFSAARTRELDELPVSATPMLDFTDDSGMGEMMAAMMAWMAAQERQMIQKRIRAGLAARKAKGRLWAVLPCR